MGRSKIKQKKSIYIFFLISLLCMANKRKLFHSKKKRILMLNVPDKNQNK